MNTTGKLGLEPFLTPDVVKLDQAHFPHPWTTDQWGGLDPDQNILFTWRIQNALVGYCLFGLPPGDNVAHLFKILIDPAHRGRGNAVLFWWAMVHAMKIKKLSRIYLEVESNNIKAILFYEKAGFKLLRYNKGYYSNGEDALMMELTL